MYSKHRIGELFVQHRAQFRSPAAARSAHYAHAIMHLDKGSVIGRARARRSGPRGGQSR